MKVHELFRRLDEDAGSESLTANLVPVLVFLIKRSEDKGLTPTLSTNSLIKLVQNAGDVTFNYEALVAASNDGAVKNLIDNFNKDKITLKSNVVDDDEDEPHEVSPDQGAVGKEETVSKMAKSALGKRK